jgi:transposase-like protein
MKVIILSMGRGSDRRISPTKILGIAKKMVTEIQPRKCKYCGSYHLVRYGHSKELQRLLCWDCGSTFMDTDALPGMRKKDKREE